MITPLLFTTQERKVGQFIALTDCEVNENIDVFKDGDYYESVIVDVISYIAFRPVWKYVPTVAGRYKFRKSAGDEITDFSGEILVTSYAVPAPTINTNNGTVGVNLTISGVQATDIVKVYRSNTTGSVDTLTVTGTTITYAPPSPGTYTFKTIRGVEESAFSIEVVVVSATNQLADLAIGGLGQLFVNDSRDILGIASGATLVVRLNNLPTTINVDYQLTGINIKFLKAGDYKIWQTKASFVDSAKLAVSVAEGVKPNLPTPTLSGNAVTVGGTITVTNIAQFDSISLKKGQSTAVLAGDYSLLGGVITFLNVGSYRVYGHKLNYNDSELSSTIDVTDVSVPKTEKVLQIDMLNLCGSKITDLEFGMSTSQDVQPTTWYNPFETGVSNSIPYAKIKTVEDLSATSVIFARMKNEPLSVSVAVTIR
ncbi:hypothetical protein VB796_08750 [Arcicella sp. LKC2W]|uniref:hypothetical protein n=1 Tax=Arcicella sp. LKC2W TaxID=2984198 RepID=UPI002B21437F|nr:hypothetical protein [Arcicella sp. LKC2W]MEA5459123.1 hypothetical protein [Arcicella sp. LKC2W]